MKNSFQVPRRSARMALVLSLLSLVFLFCPGCLLHSPDVPESPPVHPVAGQVVSSGTHQALPTAIVRVEGRRIPVDQRGKFLTALEEGPGKQISVQAPGHKTLAWAFDVLGPVNFRQISIKQTWDFASTKLIGWSDPVSGAYYYDEKFGAILADTAAHGSNCCIINADRSWGLQYHDGNCGARGTGWWSHIVNDGWLPQFGDVFESCFENIHESREVNAKWLDLIERRVQQAAAAGQWAIVNLWCPYDEKWYGLDWFYWVQDCNASPYVDGSRYFTDWQKSATLALVERLKDYPNVIWHDSWETTGVPGSVNLRWKKLCYQWVRSIDQDAPYFVYLDNYCADYTATVQWVNSTPGIAGLNSHYNLGNSHSDYGLSPDKWLMASEEVDLGPAATARALEWIQASPGEKRCTAMYFGSYRDYLRTDGGADTGLADREHWYPIIDELMGR